MPAGGAVAVAVVHQYEELVAVVGQLGRERGAGFQRARLALHDVQDQPTERVVRGRVHLVRDAVGAREAGLGAPLVVGAGAGPHELEGEGVEGALGGLDGGVERLNDGGKLGQKFVDFDQPLVVVVDHVDGLFQLGRRHLDRQVPQEGLELLAVQRPGPVLVDFRERPPHGGRLVDEVVELVGQLVVPERRGVSWLVVGGVGLEVVGVLAAAGRA